MNITVDRVGRPAISSNELFEIIYAGHDKNITIPSTAETHAYINLANSWGLDVGIKFAKTNETEDEYISNCIEKWPMPEKYQNIDLNIYFANKITQIEQAQRVSDELELYEKYKLINVLKFMIYLVDVMRENKIVWGVGRGSSTASYCLFLVGLHRIDSLKFNLDIREFLK